MIEYLLAEIEEQRSRINHVRMWRLVFYCLEDGRLYEMTVDPTYRNFRRQGWDHVVSDTEPWGLYTGLRRTNRRTNTGMPVVTADSEVKLQYRIDDQQTVLKVIQADQEQRNPDLFRELFTHA